MGSIRQLNDMPIMSLAVVGSINQSKSTKFTMGVYHGRLLLEVYCWRFTVGVYNVRLPQKFTESVYCGRLLKKVYHGSFQWEFTALTYF